MTPQERQLVAELFDRLQALEREPRDAEAERLIRDGLRQAPNAVYPLVQTVLVQDEALKVANDRIEELEEALQPPQQTQDRGFLDRARDSFFGRDEPRGSVPRVAPGAPQHGSPWTNAPASNAPMGAPPGYRSGYEQPGVPMQQAPMQPEPQRPGGSFLGTAAAAAAGAIGGSLLMGGISRMLGGHQQGPAAGAFDQLSRPRADEATRAFDPGNSTGDLSRDAGLNDIGRNKTAFGDLGDTQQTRSAGLFDSSQAQADAAQDAQQDADDEQDDAQDSAEYEDDGSYDDSGDTETA